MPSLNLEKTPGRVRPSRGAEMRMHETRDAARRESEIDYSPPSLLELPQARPGFQLRWVRERLTGLDVDRDNLAKKRKEGYAAARVESYPEFAPEADPDGLIRRGNMLLMEVPTDRAEARRRYYADRARRQVEAADALREFQPVNGRRLPAYDQSRPAEMTVVGGKRATG